MHHKSLISLIWYLILFLACSQSSLASSQSPLKAADASSFDLLAPSSDSTRRHLFKKMSSFHLGVAGTSRTTNTAGTGTLNDGPHTRTQQPIVTGTTVIGIKYKGGVLLAADTLASYGSMARYKDMRRLTTHGKHTILGASGEMSDFQSIKKTLGGMDLEDINQDDGYTRSPAEVFNYLRAVMYQRRNKGNPLWNQLLIAGYKNDSPFLGYVDLIGTAYEENFIATGFGAYLAMPLIREKWTADMEEGEAIALVEDCLRVLFYRDCRASNRVQIAKATAEGIVVSDPYPISHDWETATYDDRHAVRADGSSW